MSERIKLQGDKVFMVDGLGGHMYMPLAHAREFSAELAEFIWQNRSRGFSVFVHRGVRFNPALTSSAEADRIIKEHGLQHGDEWHG